MLPSLPANMPVNSVMSAPTINPLFALVNKGAVAMLEGAHPLGGLALATDAPTDELLRKPPVDVDAPIVTRRMRAHIASQAAYQLAVVFALLASGRRRLVFNAFVWMQLVNQINCRKVNERFDVFEGAWRNPTFLGIFASEVGLQVLIVQRGGVVFDTEPLDANQWAACVALGLVEVF